MKRDYRFLIIFICMFIAGCARLKNIDSINAKKIKNEVDEYYSKFSAQSMLGNIKTVNKLSTEWSPGWNDSEGMGRGNNKVY